MRKRELVKLFEDEREARLEAESDIRDLTRVISRHHAVDLVHARCGDDAIAREWGRTCEVCRDLGYLGMTAREDEFAPEYPAIRED